MKFKINPAFDLLMVILLIVWVAAGAFLNYAAQEKNEEIRNDETSVSRVASRSE